MEITFTGLLIALMLSLFLWGLYCFATWVLAKELTAEDATLLTVDRLPISFIDTFTRTLASLRAIQYLPYVLTAYACIYYFYNHGNFNSAPLVIAIMLGSASAICDHFRTLSALTINRSVLILSVTALFVAQMHAVATTLLCIGLAGECLIFRFVPGVGPQDALFLCSGLAVAFTGTEEIAIATSLFMASASILIGGEAVFRGLGRKISGANGEGSLMIGAAPGLFMASLPVISYSTIGSIDILGISLLLAFLVLAPTPTHSL